MKANKEFQGEEITRIDEGADDQKRYES